MNKLKNNSNKLKNKSRNKLKEIYKQREDMKGAHRLSRLNVKRKGQGCMNILKNAQKKRINLSWKKVRGIGEIGGGGEGERGYLYKQAINKRKQLINAINKLKSNASKELWFGMRVCGGGPGFKRAVSANSARGPQIPRALKNIAKFTGGLKTA